MTQGPANSYAFCYYYNVVDLTPWLRQGNNQLAIHVYYQGLVNRAYNSGDQRQGLIAELFADGVQLLDEDWLCARAEEYINAASCTGGSCSITTIPIGAKPR